MPAPSSFEYAVVRVVPSVAREEFVNAGVILFCGARDFLAARIELDDARLLALAPEIDLPFVRRHLEAIPRVCAGGGEAGPIGGLSARERWMWLVAPRSTIIQTSPAHPALGDALDASLERLLETTVRAPRGRSSARPAR